MRVFVRVSVFAQNQPGRTEQQTRLHKLGHLALLCCLVPVLVLGLTSERLFLFLFLSLSLSAPLLVRLHQSRNGAVVVVVLLQAAFVVFASVFVFVPPLLFVSLPLLLFPCEHPGHRSLPQTEGEIVWMFETETESRPVSQEQTNQPVTRNAEVIALVCADVSVRVCARVRVSVCVQA